MNGFVNADLWDFVLGLALPSAAALGFAEHAGQLISSQRGLLDGLFLPASLALAHLGLRGQLGPDGAQGAPQLMSRPAEFPAAPDWRHDAIFPG